MKRELSIQKKDDVNYAQKLLTLGFLKPPEKCKCNGIKFKIQYDSNSKSSHCIYRCQNTNVKTEFQLDIILFLNNFLNYP